MRRPVSQCDTVPWLRPSLLLNSRPLIPEFSLVDRMAAASARARGVTRMVSAGTEQIVASPLRALRDPNELLIGVY
ncbi:hypothetical protein GCM10027271_28420 [Saccharopolyspora gloriosae]